MPRPRTQWLEFVAYNGSHHIYGQAGVNARISVPVHGNDSLKSGLLRHAMKIAALTEADL